MANGILGEVVRLGSLIFGVAALIAFWLRALQRVDGYGESPSSRASATVIDVRTTKGPVEEFRELAMINRWLGWMAIVGTVVITLIGATLFLWILFRYGGGETGR